MKIPNLLLLLLKNHIGIIDLGAKWTLLTLAPNGALLMSDGGCIIIIINKHVWKK